VCDQHQHQPTCCKQPYLEGQPVCIAEYGEWLQSWSCMCWFVLCLAQADVLHASAALILFVKAGHVVSRQDVVRW
jgi:hypothetical protein